MKTKPYMLATVKRYQHSPRGKETRKAYTERNKERISNYIKGYMVKRRERAKILGKCVICAKKPHQPGFVSCERCRAMQRENRLKRLKRCPKCGSPERVYAPGSTNLIPIPSINWICKRCLYEW